MFFPWRERKERKTLDEKEEKERRRKRENTQKKLFCRRLTTCTRSAPRMRRDWTTKTVFQHEDEGKRETWINVDLYLTLSRTDHTYTRTPTPHYDDELYYRRRTKGLSRVSIDVVFKDERRKAPNEIHVASMRRVR